MMGFTATRITWVVFSLTVISLTVSSTYAQNNQRKSCKEECYPKRVNCISRCKEGFWLNLSKSKFLLCADKCDTKALKCSPRCECLAVVEREKAGCDQACKSYRFRSSFDEMHCLKECKFEYEGSQKICRGGRRQPPKDVETVNGNQS
ncbi:uncharacterized protein LOC133186041 [Saccostrea echinata]|uniref:uncharacterized protein LOC133186041 n=1 Tax=Saccostrea echinata TaxID=191078 RepID=UPI002A800B4C|nr:uncharacterized protein LOC133186041 [Saccostrea echinata]